jgi:hypothetical protein
MTQNDAKFSFLDPRDRKRFTYNFAGLNFADKSEGAWRQGDQMRL